MAPIPTLVEEHRLWRAGCRLVAGLDEAGRGAWAGPIVAAAVVLSPRDEAPAALAGVRDSKQLAPKTREHLHEVIRASALAVGVGIMPPALIDAIGIGGANRLAMAAAIADLGLAVDHLLIDYLRLPAMPTPQSPIADGDALCLSIAAASVIAKVTRDRLMVELDALYPGYGFARHKGYGTDAHRQALQALGVCHIHRLSFAPMAGVRALHHGDTEHHLPCGLGEARPREPERREQTLDPAGRAAAEPRGWAAAGAGNAD